MRREGLRKGVHDLALPVPLHGFGGLYIELKRPKEPGKAAGKVSKEQKEWLAALAEAGNAVHVCYGWDAAREVIERYLGPGELG